MSTEHLQQPLSPQEHAALIDAAKLRAMELRREAMRDFWSAVRRAVRRSWHRATRESARARRLRLQP
jgi:hypothetical protein